MRKKALSLLLILVLSAGFLMAREKRRQQALILSPLEDSMWTGRQTFAVELKNIEQHEVRQVEFYLDGRLLKEFTVPPYTLVHDFGGAGHNHTIKVLVRGDGMTILAMAKRKSYQVDASYNLEVKQVVVPVVVKESSGNYVRGLNKEDFILLSDGKPTPISHIKTSGTVRFNMVQVIDFSYSMRAKLRQVLAASSGFMHQLMSKNDKATFVFFNHRVYDHLGFTSSIKELDERLMLEAPAVGGTALFDAVSYSLNLVSKTPGRNIIVIFSDGEDNSSYIDRFSLLKKVKKTPVTIYVIDNAQGPPPREDTLLEICNLTGGMKLPLDDVRKTKIMYGKIREEISAQYVLYFKPDSREQKTFKRFHPIQVKVKGGKYSIRTIKGYY